jgi:outer membrane protein OmpA-like peptidoglycan-associated protein
MTERIAEVNRQVVIIEQSLRDGAYDRDIAELRQLMQALDLKQNELDNRFTAEREQKTQNVETSVASLLSVFFRLNSAVVDNFNYERIAAAARFMAANPTVKIMLVGHTDSTGPSAFNMALSERRSKAVYDILVEDFKIDPSRLSTSFRGPNDPLSEQNRNVNRRVDFVVID